MFRNPGNFSVKQINLFFKSNFFNWFSKKYNLEQNSYKYIVVETYKNFISNLIFLGHQMKNLILHNHLIAQKTQVRNIVYFLCIKINITSKSILPTATILHTLCTF